MALSSWTSGPHGQLSSGSQIKIVPTLNVYRSRARAGANHCADRCTFTTTCNRTDDSADRSTDSCALHSLAGLVAIANRAFVIDAHYLAIRRTNGFEDTGEAISLAVAHTNRVEIQRHLRATGNTATTIHR